MSKQSINTIKNWFKNGSFPNQFHFWDWMDSFFHKDEQIPSGQIEDLQNLLDAKVDKKDLPDGDVAISDVSGLNTALDTKVDKEEGKALSSEDFTTALKDKLEAVEENANNYQHPVTHSADVIDETTEKSFISSAEKQNLSDHLADTEIHKSSAQIRSEIVDSDLPVSIARQEDVTTSANSVIDIIRGGVDEAYNTLKKVYDWIFVHDGNTDIHKTSEQIRSEIVEIDIPVSLARVSQLTTENIVGSVCETLEEAQDKAYDGYACYVKADQKSYVFKLEEEIVLDEENNEVVVQKFIPHETGTVDQDSIVSSGGLYNWNKEIKGNVAIPPAEGEMVALDASLGYENFEIAFINNFEINLTNFVVGNKGVIYLKNQGTEDRTVKMYQDGINPNGIMLSRGNRGMSNTSTFDIKFTSSAVITKLVYYYSGDGKIYIDVDDGYGRIKTGYHLNIPSGISDYLIRPTSENIDITIQSGNTTFNKITFFFGSQEDGRIRIDNQSGTDLNIETPYLKFADNRTYITVKGNSTIYYQYVRNSAYAYVTGIYGANDVSDYTSILNNHEKIYDWNTEVNSGSVASDNATVTLPATSTRSLFKVILGSNNTVNFGDIKEGASGVLIVENTGVSKTFKVAKTSTGTISVYKNRISDFTPNVTLSSAGLHFLHYYCTEGGKMNIYFSEVDERKDYYTANLSSDTTLSYIDTAKAKFVEVKINGATITSHRLAQRPSGIETTVEFFNNTAGIIPAATLTSFSGTYNGVTEVPSLKAGERFTVNLKQLNSSVMRTTIAPTSQYEPPMVDTSTYDWNAEKLGGLSMPFNSSADINLSTIGRGRVLKFNTENIPTFNFLTSGLVDGDNGTMIVSNTSGLNNFYQSYFKLNGGTDVVFNSGTYDNGVSQYIAGGIDNIIDFHYAAGKMYFNYRQYSQTQSIWKTNSSTTISASTTATTLLLSNHKYRRYNIKATGTLTGMLNMKTFQYAYLKILAERDDAQSVTVSIPNINLPGGITEMVIDHGKYVMLCVYLDQTGYQLISYANTSAVVEKPESAFQVVDQRTGYKLYRNTELTESSDSIGIGYNAMCGNGGGTPGNQSIGIGNQAGQNGGGAENVFIGGGAGFGRTLQRSVQIGRCSSPIGDEVVSVGYRAGAFADSACGAWIGSCAGVSAKSNMGVGIGRNAGTYGCGYASVNIGADAGNRSCSTAGIAIGQNSLRSSTGCYAIGIGSHAGYSGTGEYSFHAGYLSGYEHCGNNAIGIGPEAGRKNTAADSLHFNASSTCISPLSNIAVINPKYYETDTDRPSASSSNQMVYGNKDMVDHRFLGSQTTVSDNDNKITLQDVSGSNDTNLIKFVAGDSTVQGYFGMFGANGLGYAESDDVFKEIHHSGNSNLSNIDWAAKDITAAGTGTFGGTVTASNFIGSSDKTLKENISSIDTNIDSVPLVKFNFKNDETKREHHGVIAQDLQVIAPDMVYEKEDGKLGVDYTGFLIAKIDALQKDLIDWRR